MARAPADSPRARSGDPYYREFAENHREEMIRHLRQILRIESVKAQPEPGAPFGIGVAEALTAFLDRAEAEGFRVFRIPGVAGHVEWGPEGAPIIGVLAHLDVVPEGLGWTRKAFGGEVQDGRIYGRGSQDDKGPAVAAYWALKAVRERQISPTRRVRLIVGGDEESGFACMHAYFDVQEKPLMGFTPDADFPMVTAEKGIVTLTLSAPAPAAASGETALLSLAAGTRANVVAAEARARLRVPATRLESVLAALAGVRLPAGTSLTVGNPTSDPEGRSGDVVEVDLHALGRAAHAMDPARGANAAACLCAALAEPQVGLGESVRVPLLFLAQSGLDVSGGGLGVRCEDLESGPLTANLGLLSLNVAPDGGALLTAQFNLRYPVTAQIEDLIAGAEAAARPNGMTVTAGHHQRPLRADPGSELVRTLDRVWESETGLPTAHLAIGGGTYARELPMGVAFGAVFPGDEDRMHAADESLRIDRLLEMTALYGRAIEALLAPEAGGGEAAR